MRKQIIESILIFSFGGIVMGYLMCNTCFEDFWNAIYAISYSGLLWLSLWKGNEFVSSRTDKYISWLEAPVKRFFISLGSMLAYTITASALLSFAFYILVFRQDFGDAILKTIISTVLSSIGITAFIMLIFNSVSFFKSWRQAAINEEILRKEHISSQYEALKSQVNPHFLFNSLNALSSLIYEDQDKAVRYINRLSDVYRYVLDAKDREVSHLEEEMNFVDAYIQLQSARHEENLKVSVDVASLEGYVLPLSIQMLVENAIKHNIVSSDQPLSIEIRRKDDRIEVSNNLQIKPNVESSNQGLVNIQSRYGILSDKKMIIEKTEKTFAVSLPILKFK